MLQDVSYDEAAAGKDPAGGDLSAMGEVRSGGPVHRLTPRHSASLVSQHTVRNRIVCTGLGLHSGQPVTMTISPAPTGSGILFRRGDLARDGAVPGSVPSSVTVPARHDLATDLVLGTNIANEAGARIGTIEHLMAALSGLGIDNALIELDGPEVPVMDGSSAPFVFLIECADREPQAAPRRYIEILKPIEVREADGQGRERIATLEPDREFRVSLEIDFDNPLVGVQRCDFRLGDDTFKAELCRARTFGFVGDVERLHALGLALGGSLDNAVVVSGDQVLNEGGLRYADEFVRHKALDAIGDLYLAGAPILGRFRGVRSGHALNNRLLRALFADETAWRYTFQPRADQLRADPSQAAEPLAAIA